MKILLAQSLSYLFSRGGAQKANRAYMEGLVERGHQCRVAAPAAFQEGATLPMEAFLEEMERRQHPVTSVSAQAVIFQHHGVDVHAVTETRTARDWHGQSLGSYVIQQIEAFEPDWILIPDDYSYGLMEAALLVSPERVIALVYTPAVLPFGPLSWIRDATKAQYLRKTAAVITISHFIAEYIEQWEPSLNTVVLPMPVFGQGPFPYLANFDAGYVVMLNPSAIKGLSIFLDLARQMPEVDFAAVPSWATREDDHHALQKLPNVRLLPPSDNLNTILAQTRVLLMPSLWAEGFTLTSVETMLRGVPVIASNVGGLPEAKLGVEYVLPANPIVSFVEGLGQWPPEPIVPDQDVRPWRETLRQLLSDRPLYDRIAQTSQTAAQAYISGISVEPLENYLQQLRPTSSSFTPSSPAGTTPPKQERLLASLSPQQRKLLALKLARKQKVAAADPILEES